MLIIGILLSVAALWLIVMPSLQPWRRSFAGFSAVASGEPGTASFRLWLHAHREPVSFWHDVPLDADVLLNSHIVPMIVEIPKGQVAKLEINKETHGNPIIQDTKNGKLRDYPFANSAQYGAIPRTFEDPGSTDPFTDLKGDGDPVDVLDLSDAPVSAGEVVALKVLGGIGMVDGGEIDWKVIGIRADDPAAAHVSDLSRVMQCVRVEAAAPGDAPAVTFTDVHTSAQASLSPAEKDLPSRVFALRSFFADYKRPRPDALSPVSFAFEGVPVDADTAARVILHAHAQWCALKDAQARPGACATRMP